MKRITFIFLAVLMLAVFSSPCFAQVRFGIQSTGGLESSTALVLPAGSWVYGFKVYADANSSFAAFYDAATLGNTVPLEAVDEIGEATQYDSVEVWYPKPIYCANGVSVKITTGIATIFYGPPPD